LFFTKLIKSEKGFLNLCGEKILLFKLFIGFSVTNINKTFMLHSITIQ
jgi:hypothetical protein